MDSSTLSPSAQIIPPAGVLQRFVNVFALIVILLSAILLIALVTMAWLNIGTPGPTADNIKGLFNVLLPLIGTWMGTLLAFYFSKDNFEAASRQAQALAKQINTAGGNLQVLKVSDIMIKPNDSSLLIVNDEASFKTQKLSDLIKKMEESDSDRLPILQKGTLKYIFLIYRSTIERFIVAVTTKTVSIAGETIDPSNIPDLTINDMYLSDFKLFKDILAINKCFLPINTTLDKVQQAMLDNSVCQDVFITQNGDKDETVEGWITNNMIIEKAELFKKAGSRS